MSSPKSSDPILESLELGDADINTLSLSQGSDNYSSSEYEAYVSIDSELDMNAEEVEATEEEAMMLEESIEEGLEIDGENEVVEGDVEMADVSEENEALTEQVIYSLPSNKNSQNVVFPSKSTFQKIVPPSSTSSKVTIPAHLQGQSIMIVSPAGGQGTSQILKISHPPTASQSQLQSIAQTLITAKSAEGNIVQLRSAQPGKPLVATTQSSSVTVSNFQSPKTIQATIKRPAPSPPQTKTVITKMIVASSAGNSGTNERIISTTRNNLQPTIKFINASSNPHPVTSSTKIVTLAQANQMGLLTGNVVAVNTKNQQMKHPVPKPGQKIIKVVTMAAPSSQPMRSVGSKTPAMTTTAKATTTMMSSTTSTPTSTSGPPKLHFPSTGLSPTVNQVSTGPTASSSMNIIVPASYVQKKSEEIKPKVYHRKLDAITSLQSTLVSTSSVTSTAPSDSAKTKPVSSIVDSGDSKMKKLHSMGFLPGNVITVGNSKVQVAHGIQKIGTGQRIVKVVPLNTSGQPLRAVAPKSALASSGNQRFLIPNTPKNSNNSTIGNIVVIPAQYLQQNEEKKGKQQSAAINVQSSQASSSSTMSAIITDSKASRAQPLVPVDPNGLRPRKPCNCTKSQCLKLYCDCFANGEFCYMCNCNNCLNNLGNEEERQRAIKSCLERNPNAFRPKIGKGREVGDESRRHNKGCNCKRSGCLKNYCECYEAKIPCSGNCKCVGCRNIEDGNMDKKSDFDENPEARNNQLLASKGRIQHLADMAFRIPATSNTGPRQPFNFLTDKVVEITCQCLMAQAEEADRNMYDEDTSQRLIIEEFGRCLKEIIESGHKAEDS